MVFLVSLLIGTQVLCSLAGHPPQRESPPPPPPPPPPPHRLMSPPCNSSSVKMAAELALDKLNEHRREGYVLGLQRIFDAHELEWQETGSLFYLTLDVMETDCHELSRKSWKDCQFRQAHESVYGQCKATFYINRPWRILHLFNYDCVLRHVPAAVIAKMCPDCPTPKDPTEPECLEAATQSLAKFNAESNHTHYFKVHNVTRASYQWVVGPSNFVDYVIQETSCPKSQPLDDLSKCPFLPDETADVGVCKGSVIDSQIEHQKFVTASCEVFHPQVKGGEQAGKRKPGHHDDDESREDDGHSKGGRKGHHDDHSGGGKGGHRDGHSGGGRGEHRDGHSQGGRGEHRDGHSEGGRGEHRDGHSQGGRGEHHDGHSEGGKGEHRDGHSEGGRGEHHDGHSQGGRGEHRDGHSQGGRGEHEDGHSEGGRGGHRDGHSGGGRGGHHDGHSEGGRGGHRDGHSGGGRGGDLGKTVGRVTVLPLSNTHVSLHSLPDIERLDGAPVPPQLHEPKPVPNLPDIHGAPDEGHPLGKPMGRPPLTRPVRPVIPPPFPAEFSQSDTCPGEILASIHGLDPLLPKRPAEVLPTGTAEHQAQEKVKH